MIVVVIFAGPILLFQPTEPQIRLGGLFLQLLGLSTVLSGISQTRKLFNLPSLLTVAVRWLMSFPKFRLERRVARMIGQAGEFDLAARMKARHQAGPDASLEDRVRVLEANLQLLDQQSDNLQHQLDEANRQANSALAAESQSRERALDNLREKLTLTETGGLDVSLMGLIWLMVGLVITTASIELSRLP